MKRIVVNYQVKLVSAGRPVCSTCDSKPPFCKWCLSGFRN